MRFIILCVAGLLSASVAAGTPETVTLSVQNMTCAACPITVKKALTQVPGVGAVSIDYEHKTATVTFDPVKVNAAQLAKATADAGFPSTVRK